MEEIEKNGYNLNISRYVSTAAEEEIINLADVKKNLDDIEDTISKAKAKHNQFLTLIVSYRRAAASVQ